ncbi:WPP domain-interacting protein 2-like [Bidens hawaiensis]|uniref:WPP domain-interacting protein 2-like n=1 Tax=Bidens hawaiensis TaxID=980011 RepID=UPI004049663F
MDLESVSKLKDNSVAGDSPSPLTSPVPATKGKGLRKWRRIHRESGKEPNNNNFDNNKKRGMMGLPGGVKPSEGSSPSTNAMSNIIGNALDHVNVYGDLGFRKGIEFGSRADSENSRSSTGASVPRGNRDLFNLSFKGSDGLVQKSDQKEKCPDVKKSRGSKLKKENSISSLESDSRSSNFVFSQGANSVNSNGLLNGRSGNYDEDSDDARDGDASNYLSQTVFSKNHDGDENVSFEEDLDGENSWEVKKEKIDDRVGSGDRDPLVEAIIPLHLAQEALEREVQKSREVGTEDISSSTSNVSDLQSKLEEAFNALEIKNTKISELESTLNSTKIQTEYEELMTKRIAAEVEYLVISKTIQNLKAGPVGQTNLADQKNVSATTPAAEEDAKKLKNRVWRYVYCLIIQSVLLLVALFIIVLKFSSKTVEVIPT